MVQVTYRGCDSTRECCRALMANVAKLALKTSACTCRMPPMAARMHLCMHAGSLPA